MEVTAEDKPLVPREDDVVADAERMVEDDEGEGRNDEEDQDALEIAAMRARVAEIEKEAALLRQFSAVATAEADAVVPMSDDEKEAVDSRSIYVGNVSGMIVYRCAGDMLAELPGLLVGGLRLDTRRDSSSLCFLWYYQPSHHPI